MVERADRGDGAPRITILSPTPLLMVEITEPFTVLGRSRREADIHLHPGGQGLWVARMAASLGARVSVCGPFGGELGPVIVAMLTELGMTVHSVPYHTGNGGYVHDLRGPDREVVAHMPPPVLTRHELDDLYGTVLVEALDSDVLVVTGNEPADVVPASFYGRLVRDVRASEVPVVADLSGDAALAAASAGVDLLKMSHEEVTAAGLAADDSVPALVEGARDLLARGVGAVMVSRAGEPALLVEAGAVSEISSPRVTPVDHRGAGDSMTAGMAVGLARGLALAEAARLGASAGSLNVTRHGLGTGRRTTVERFARRIAVRRRELPQDGGPEG